MHEIFFDDSLCKGCSAFERMAKLQNEVILSPEKELQLKIILERRTGLTFVFLLGCLPVLAESRNKYLRIVASDKLFQLFRKTNILEYYQSENLPKQLSLFDDESPAFRKISSTEDIISLVKEGCIEAPIEMSDDLEAILTSRIGEMFQNSWEHADAKFVMGGKYFKQQKYKYCFSCYDTGVGIPARVNSFRMAQGLEKLLDLDALKWAMRKGNSTNAHGMIPRGVGLDLLKNFAKANKGAIRICSGKAVYILNSSGDHYSSLQTPFIGTLFEMDIIADKTYKYILD